MKTITIYRAEYTNDGMITTAVATAKTLAEAIKTIMGITCEAATHIEDTLAWKINSNVFYNIEIQ